MAILNGNKYTVPFGSLKCVVRLGLYEVYRYLHTDRNVYFFVIRRGKVLYKAFTCGECLAFIKFKDRKTAKSLEKSNKTDKNERGRE